MESIRELTERVPGLTSCAEHLAAAADCLEAVFRGGGTLFLCGNGGSAADCEHIVGELAKSFRRKRPLPEELLCRLQALLPEAGEKLGALEQGLPAVAIPSMTALMTAFSNDRDPALAYAQAVLALAKPGDALLCLSTSGNSENIVNAAAVGKALGLSVISLTGAKPCRLDSLSRIVIHVDASDTARVQELHLPAYHWLCGELEERFFGTGQ